MLTMKTKNQAIYVAKQIVKEQAQVKRLPYSNIKTCDGYCNCGETEAVKVDSVIGGKYFDAVVSFCENCGGKP